MTGLTKKGPARKSPKNKPGGVDRPGRTSSLSLGQSISIHAHLLGVGLTLEQIPQTLEQNGLRLKNSDPTRVSVVVLHKGLRKYVNSDMTSFDIINEKGTVLLRVRPGKTQVFRVGNHA